MTNNSVSSSANKSSSKKKSGGKIFLRRFCAVIIIILIFWWFNNFTIKMNKVNVSSDKIKSSVRIAVISDLHATKVGISNKKIVNKIKKADPDMVMMLGDMYTSGSDSEIMQIPVNLTGEIIGEGYPVYLVTGEHDTDRSFVKAVTEVGAKVLNYDSTEIEINGNKIRIYGIDNVHYSSTFDLSNEFQLDDSYYNILLAHIPNYKKFAQFGADLTICADTHGGIIQMPFDKGPVYYSETRMFLPEIFHKEIPVYDKGLFKYEGGAMFVTSGIGSYPIAARINNRPEIAIIDVVAE